MMRGARSIRQKLQYVLAMTTLIALLIAGTALAAIDLRTRLSAMEADLITQADVLALSSSAALAFDDRRVAVENLRVLRAKPSVTVAALYAPGGEVFASYAADGEASVPPRPGKLGAEVDSEWVRVWRPVMANQERVGTVYVQARHELAARALEYFGVLVLVLGVSFAVALLLSNRLQGLITTPLQEIGDAARGVKEGNFELRAHRTTRDEIGELADAFNAMLDELERRARTREDAIEALRASDERYQLAVRGSSAGLWDWDIQGDAMFYAPRFRALLGYTEAEFPDAPSSFSTVLHPDDLDPVRDALREHLRSDRPFSVECRLRRKSGDWGWFQTTGMAQRDANGRAFRMAGSIVDVTERKHAEKVLQEANRAKDEFIATLAHELRNPLAPIRTGLDILRRDRQRGPASERARETMGRQLAHMIRLIDDLLDISRINSGKIRLEKERMHLSEAIDVALEVSRPTIEARGHVLNVELPPHDIVMVGDATRIAQAIGNLLNNAAKYTPADGQVKLSAWQDGDCAVVEVSDNGVGIPVDMLDSIFGLFTQVGRTLDRAQGGLGIGLYLVRSLIELHGGSVSAASAGPGCGSAFAIRLPCLPTETQAPRPPVALQPSKPPTGLKVLVVDDNVDAAETLSTVLEMTGRRTRAVHDGESVQAAAREFAPDVILLDIGLPGISGYEVARRLRADPQFARTHIVAITGWGGEEDRRRSREAGFDDHLTKPVELEALEPLLQRFTPVPS